MIPNLSMYSTEALIKELGARKDEELYAHNREIKALADRMMFHHFTDKFEWFGDRWEIRIDGVDFGIDESVLTKLNEG